MSAVGFALSERPGVPAFNVGHDVVNVREIDSDGGLAVEHVPFNRLCAYISEIPGVVFTRRRRFFWSAHDIRAEFTFGSCSFKTWPEPGQDCIWICANSPSNQTKLLEMRTQLAQITPREGRKACGSARNDAILSSLVSLTILLGGCLYPAMLLVLAPERKDQEFRTAAIFPIPLALVFGVILATRAVKQFRRAYPDFHENAA